MTRIIQQGRKRRTPLFAMALVGVVVGVMIGGGGFGAAAPSTAPSIADYSQCANGTAFSTACPSGWINGILNANNSSYREDKVTAQRLLIAIPKGASLTGHSLDVTYLTRKGSASAHAYDSLATWNASQTTANRCDGLTSTWSGCSAASELDFPMVSDTTEEPPVNNSVDDHVNKHELTGSNFQFEFYGPVASAQASAPTHDSEADATTDDYATVHVSYALDSSIAGQSGKVASDTFIQLVFGGHLAASGTPPTSPRGWGVGLGAANINGGPYHIRITAMDGASIGNRDNQIMSSAILPLALANVVTSPHATASTTFSWSATGLHDSASVTGNAPTGSVTFTLYGPFSTAPGASSCIATGNAGANQLWTSGAINLSTGTSSNNGNTITVDSGNASGFTIGSAGTYTTSAIYQWVVSYTGDPNNTSFTGQCGDTGEQETVTAGSVTNASVSPGP